SRNVVPACPMASSRSPGPPKPSAEPILTPAPAPGALRPRRPGHPPPSAKPPGNIILRHPLPRVREELHRPVELDDLAEHEERGGVRDARGLLHVGRHDHD